jgi:hypothetical protein
MRVQKDICDGCVIEQMPETLVRYSDGKGGFAELCEACVRKAVLRALKREVFILRSECNYCRQRGVVLYQNKGWLECPVCCQ